LNYNHDCVFERVQGGDLKDAIDRRDFNSIAITTDEKMPFTFELSTGNQQSRIYFLAAETEEERFEWIARIALVSLCSFKWDFFRNGV
jgi:PH domain